MLRLIPFLLADDSVRGPGDPRSNAYSEIRIYLLDCHAVDDSTSRDGSPAVSSMSALRVNGYEDRTWIDTDGSAPWDCRISTP